MAISIRPITDLVKDPKYVSYKRIRTGRDVYRRSSLFINLVILLFMRSFNGNSTYDQLPTS